MRINRHAHSCETGSLKRMEAIKAPSKREDTLAPLRIALYPKNTQLRKGTRRGLKNGNHELGNIAGSYPGRSCPDQRHSNRGDHSEGQNRIARTENRLENMLQGLVNKTIDEKFNSVEFENGLLPKIEDVTSSQRPETRMTEAMLDKQDFIAPVIKVFMKETEKALDVESKREDQRSRFVEAAYSTAAAPASSSGRPPTEIFDKKTNKKEYPKMS